MIKIFKLLRPKFKWLSALTCMLTVISVIAFLTVPVLIGEITKIAYQISATGNPSQLVDINIFKIWTVKSINAKTAIGIVSAAFVGVMFVATSSSLSASYLANYLSAVGSRDIRLYLWRHLGALSQKDIEDFSHAKIMTRFTIDIQRIQFAIMSFLRTMLIGPINLVIGLVFALITDLHLSIIFAVLIPLILIFMGIFSRILIPAFIQEQKAQDDINIQSQENILGAKVIKSYNLEKNQHAKFYKESLNIAKLNQKEWFGFNGLFSIIMLIANIATLFVVAIVGATSRNVGSALLISNKIKNVNIFVNYVMVVTHGMIMTAFVLFNIYRGRVSSKRIYEILDRKPDIEFISSDKKVTSGKIEFKNVTFKYFEHAEKNIIENINFSVNPGEVFGIIGPTGSGKSTIAKLMSLDFKTHDGQVLIDDHDILQIDTTSLRSNISHIYQKPVILSGTVKSNLLFAKNDANFDDIEKACKIACAWEYINKFNDKFDHKIEPKGANLSGGQKQRLSIAQGVIRRPKILILDDSTSALDTKTESQVLHQIKEEFSKQKITTIIITQKISSILNADKIAVLHHGIIEDIGTHEELMRKNKLYQEIALTQLGGENE
ncbi:ATP-binding cassette subfamily B protein [Metamycoplasma subdolum]|uniref:ATP-binding cassette subfamily B protein n=1 Tax=Metamycoplasma subdolum TaxID=92407 RepID=A0A3M0A3C0_9BACT|nr:ABC transporter ATP-binding protein [Metamycoplasma subdolum]RMA79136.1 ATP-binding cassette subfamily B protein [Metamycoplasma subdolum]WPB50658.1 ABC transporter ATP-binding protein [Metamycoplasma subdolum]